MSRLFDAISKSGEEAAQVLYAAATDGTEVYKNPAGLLVVSGEPLGPSGIPNERKRSSYGLGTLNDIVGESVRVKPDDRLIFYTEPSSVGADRIRYLRMHLRKRSEARALKTVLISSPISNDGKSTIALNLATALAAEGKHRVLLLEADLHHASLVSQLGLTPGGGGLVDCLERNVDPLTVMRRVDPLGWYLLPAGQVHSNPTDLLQTKAYGHVIKTVGDHFDWILVDSPPVVPVTDALLLGQHSDGILLVVRAGHTPQEAVNECLRLLGNQHILAVVLNAAEGLDRLYYKYGTSYSSRDRSLDESA